MRNMLALLPLFALAVLAGGVASAGPYSMDHVAIGGGQTSSVAGSYSLAGGVGDAFVLSSAGGPYTLQAGFWALPFTSTTDVPDATVPLVTGRLRHGPNPFSARADIGFELATAQAVSLAIFDLRGARVRTLLDGHRDAGRYQVPWDGRDADGVVVPAGVYWVQFTSGATRERSRIVRIP